MGSLTDLVLNPKLSDSSKVILANILYGCDSLEKLALAINRSERQVKRYIQELRKFGVKVEPKKNKQGWSYRVENVPLESKMSHLDVPLGCPT